MRILATPVFSLLALLCLPAKPAFAQQGDGQPVRPSPWVAVNIDEYNGCSRTGVDGQATRRATAEQLCSDWQHEQFPAFKNPNETAIKLARLQCVKYYRIALRLQNVFCSYGIDVALFHASSKVEAQKDYVGHQNVSQHAVAADNRTVAGINKKYMERIKSVATEFHKAYPEYLRAIGDLKGVASADFVREAGCHRQARASNLDLRSPIPGYVRQALATFSHATASTTYNDMMRFTRENYAQLKVVKEKAEENERVAAMNELGIPTQFEKAMGTGSSGDPSGPLPPTPVEGAAYGVFQDLITRGIKAKFPMLNNGYGSIVGGGIVVAYQLYQNKRVMYAETAATFVGMLNPYAGMAANVLVAAYRTSEQNQANYLEFCKAELKNKGSISAAELVDLWGKKQRDPAARKLCEDSAQMAAACVAKRSQGMPAYSGDNCDLSALERQKDQQRRQRIQVLERELARQPQPSGQTRGQ